MESRMNPDDERRLEVFFQTWREACPGPEAGRNFMPELWGRIEARRHRAAVFQRMAASFVTAACAVSLILALMLAIPGGRAPVAESESYAEALVADHSSEAGYYAEPAYVIPASEPVAR